MEKEIRYFNVADGIDCRSIEEDNKRYIVGYAALFNQESRLLTENGKKFNEVLTRTAFDEVLNSPNLDVIYNYNHNNEKLVARTSSGSLQLSVDDKGLMFRAEVPNVSYANDLYVLVQRGDLSANSFAFNIGNEGQKWEKRSDGTFLRTVSKVKGLYDVSTVNHPAYPNTSVAARSIDEIEKQESESIAEETRKAEELEKIEESEQIIKARKKLNEDFITRIYLKRNWERKQ